jgi:tetratricopeptide (TPR) repeat protein
MAATSVRQSRFFFLLLIAWLVPSGCQKHQSPDDLYAHVRGEAQRGDLDASLKDADRAFHEYARKDVGRAWQFRVLKAHVLVMRGSASEALQLLQEEPPASLSTSEIAVRRKVVSGLAYESLQQFDRAEEELKQAENLARSSQPGLLGDVEQSKGLLEIYQRKYSEADISLHKALSIAREKKKPFLEATALGALGNSAMQQEHFDAAIDWYKDALTLAKSLPVIAGISAGEFGLGQLRTRRLRECLDVLSAGC